MDEPVLDPSANEPTEAPAEAAPEEVAEPTAFSLDDPAQIEALLGNPAVQDFLDRRAASIVDTRMASYKPPQAAGDAPTVDLNEYLSPLHETFGQNFGDYLGQRDEYLLGKVSELLGPVLSRSEAEQVQQGQARIEELIVQSWNPARDGALTDPAKAAIRDLAPAYLSEMEQLYGAGPQAAEKALGKAADTIRKINAASHAAGGQSNADQLAALAAASSEPGSSGGAIDMPVPARTPDELLQRRFASGLTQAA